MRNVFTARNRLMTLNQDFSTAFPDTVKTGQADMETCITEVQLSQVDAAR
jgi:hypothetical protein